MPNSNFLRAARRGGAAYRAHRTPGRSLPGITSPATRACLARRAGRRAWRTPQLWPARLVDTSRVLLKTFLVSSGIPDAGTRPATAAAFPADIARSVRLLRAFPDEQHDAAGYYLRLREGNLPEPAPA